MSLEHLRNFSIIAHVDHGKSTLADRLLELTGTVSSREMTEQFLDRMDIERERGITIKAQTVRMRYGAQDGTPYVLNLVDTPGHVDFAYEVSRSLAACEGALLVIDAVQGIEAQTLANTYLAMSHDLALLPVINKIDLPLADPDRIRRQVEDVLGLGEQDILLTSAKKGTGVPELLEAIVARIPPPGGDPEAPLKALIVDSWFDPYRGTVALLRIFDGVLRSGMEIQMLATDIRYQVQEIGFFAPHMVSRGSLGPGEVGYLMAGMKRVGEIQVGDTVTEANRPTPGPLPGYRRPKPVVFCGIYPTEGAQYDFLKTALEKLSLNDSSFTFEPETSAALGFGFRCGFLGPLHMDIVRERLEREYNLNLLATSSTVSYRVTHRDGTIRLIHNPTALPSAGQIRQVEEPYILGTIIVPTDFLGAILSLAQEKRGTKRRLEYLDTRSVLLEYELPLGEVLFDFYDRLKSVSRGYASFDYEPLEYRAAPLVKLDLLLNGEAVDALSLILHRDNAYTHGRALAERMRGLIPRQNFEVVIQAAIGNKVIARESVKPVRKQVTAKCYGGDVTRKRKLLEKQKEGKKRMKRVGQVEVPQEAFMAVLSVNE